MAAAFTVPDGVFAPVFCTNNYFLDTKSIKKFSAKNQLMVVEFAWVSIIYSP
jgi:hypothetical protein